MKIETGKRYVRKDGKITEPAYYDENGDEQSCWVANGPEGFIAYGPSGKCCIDWDAVELVSEYKEILAHTLTPGQTYTSKNGGQWKCLAVEEDDAWLAGLYKDKPQGPAYHFKTNGDPVSFNGEHFHEYKINFEPVRNHYSQRMIRANGGEIREATQWEKHDFTIDYDLINGTPDWTTAKVTPCE